MLYHKIQRMAERHQLHCCEDVLGVVTAETEVIAGTLSNPELVPTASEELKLGIDGLMGELEVELCA